MFGRGERNAEQRAAASGVFDRDRAAMCLRKPLDNAEAKAGPIAFPSILAPEALEDVGQVFVRNTRAMIAHANLWSRASRYLDRCLARCVRERIVDQIAIDAIDRFGMPARACIPDRFEPQVAVRVEYLRGQCGDDLARRSPTAPPAKRRSA